jgi:hypothetical protein
MSSYKCPAKHGFSMLASLAIKMPLFLKEYYNLAFKQKTKVQEETFKHAYPYASRIVKII